MNKIAKSMNVLFTIVTLTLASSAWAATVKSVNSKKSQIVVTLDGLEVAKGDLLCVLSKSGKKIDCGTVSSVKGAVAFVKVTKQKIKRIKKGMTVEPDGGTGDAAVADKKSGGDTTKIYLSWAPAIASPAVFNKIGYLAPETEAPASLWEADGNVAQTLAGFGFQASIPLGSLSLIPGLRYRIFSPNRIDADYVPKRENPYVSTTTSATALGLFADVGFLNIPIGSLGGIYVAGGLDIDMSTVTLKATKKDDTGATAEGTVADAKSDLTVISGRVGSGLNLIPVKPFGISLGLNLLLPLTEFGKKFAGSIEENESRGVADPGTDLKEKLGHKKNGFGVDLQASILLAF